MDGFGGLRGMADGCLDLSWFFLKLGVHIRMYLLSTTLKVVPKHKKMGRLRDALTTCLTFENGSDSDCFIDAGHDSEVVKGQVGNYKKKVDV